MKKRAREEGKEDEDGLDEEDDEEGQALTLTMEESREEASTLHQDYQQIADFLCFDVPQFTMKILQGVPNRSLMNMN